MYNTHRGMVPAPNSRLTELLDQLRQEFESQSRSTGEYEHQCMFSYTLLSHNGLFSSLSTPIWLSPPFLPLPSVAQSING